MKLRWNRHEIGGNALIEKSPYSSFQGIISILSIKALTLPS